MANLWRFSLDYLIDIEDIREIREDWLVFYRSMFNSDVYRARGNIAEYTEQELEEDALSAFNLAIQYQPHGEITNTVDNITSILKLISFGFLIISFLLSSLLFGFNRVVLTMPIDFTTIIISLIPTDIAMIIVIYLYSLRSNEAFIQEFNRRLGFGPSEVIPANRDKEQLFCYYLWNNSLADVRKAPLLLSMYLIKLVSEKIYTRIMSIIADNLDEYIDMTGFREVASHAYQTQRELSK